MVAGKHAQLLAPGVLVGGVYEVRSLLGVGGMGQVYEAHDTLLNREVAVKVAIPYPGRSPITHEGTALAALRHPAMATVHAAGLHDGVPYLVMERIAGVPLATRITDAQDAGNALSLTEALDIAVALADGLRVVHEAGISHRDVKPDNVMLAPPHRVVLLDFGLFLPEYEAASREVIAGSPGYMAPECITHAVADGEGHLIDVYSLGMVLYELITGELPFAGSAMELMDHQLHDPVPDLVRIRPDVPQRLSQLVTEMVARDPHDRPQTMESVLWRLRACQRPFLARRKVPAALIVEPEPGERARLRAALRQVSREARIDAVGTAVEAIAHLRACRADLIVVTLELSGMSGLELAMYLRSAGLAADAEIVAVGRDIAAADRKVLSELGVLHCLARGAEACRRAPEMLRRLAPSEAV